MYIDLRHKKIEYAKKYSEYDRALTRPSLFKGIKGGVATCSQCKHKMKKSTADQQIENKRENAPICVACILGNDRKQGGVYSGRYKAIKAIQNGEKYNYKRERKSDREKDINDIAKR